MLSPSGRQTADRQGDRFVISEAERTGRMGNRLHPGISRIFEDPFLQTLQHRHVRVRCIIGNADVDDLSGIKSRIDRHHLGKTAQEQTGTDEAA
ncbi:MAG: hypothetical protein U1F61_09725 [Opitutaceae bacterium]